jgi:CHAT domain-containing protein/peptide methionine sulfoxide reductase MsrA
MRYGRAIALTGLVVGLVGLAPVVGWPGVAQTVSQTTEQQKKAEADRLFQQGWQQYRVSQFTAALQSWQQALKIYRAIKNRRGEGATLGNLGVAYFSLGNYAKAIEYHQQSLAIAREIKDRLGEGQSLGNLGIAYDSLGNYAKAIEYHQQRLAIAREIKDRRGEGQSLGNLGIAYDSLGNYAKAIEYHQQRLAIAREIKDRRGEGHSLGNLGIAYSSLSNYAKAIEYHQQSLAIFRSIKDRLGEGQSLGNLGIAYSSLGNYAKAIEYHQQRLAIAREIKDRLGEGTALGALGNGYYSLDNYAKAIEYQQQHVEIAREIKDRRGEGNALGALGLAFSALGNYAQAIEHQQQSLAISREIKDRLGEGASLGALGNAHFSLGNYAKAIEYQQQSLAIKREIKDRDGERIALNNIGVTLKKQQQSDLAIVFYKQSVNVSETIRQALRPLARDLQESYTQTVAGTYRALADLLLTQGRVLEAQQVLELLKVQELRDYTRDTRAGGETQGAPLNAIEAPVKPPFDTLIALGLQLTTCENQRPRCADRDQLLAQRATAKAQFDQQATRLRQLAQQSGSQDPAQLQQSELTVAAINIVKATPKTVLIYPLVLQDKLWLVYGLQAGKEDVVFASKEIPVSRKELSETVTQFRTLLENPRSDVKQLQQVSQKLYGWLVAPLRPQLDANGIQNLVFSLDRSTRYMPLAALHDGQKYLAQRFTLSTILTAGLTNTTDKLSPNPADNPILGLGLSHAVPGYNALPSVLAEIDAIVRSPAPDPKGIFQGREYLDLAFTLSAFKDLLDYRILHIATHGKFVSEDPEQSFLLLGNGTPLRVPDIRQLSGLGNIHLAVLSACETAKGGQDKEGIEVAGLSYYFLTQNVKSVMASLWLVNDASTALIMQQFYTHLASGTMTKAEALRQVQRDFIAGKLTAKDANALRSDILVQSTNPSHKTGPQNLAHPYYWAPFILIGNSL